MTKPNMFIALDLIFVHSAVKQLCYGNPLGEGERLHKNKLGCDR